MADDETPVVDETPKPTPVKPAGNPRMKWIIFIVIGLLSLIADQGSKIWARDTLPTHGHGSLPNGECVVPDDIVNQKCGGTAVPVIDSFWHWRLSMNPGSAFGLFSGQTFARVLLSLVGIGAVFGMLWMLKKARTDQKILHWALALVAGGAVGNLIDRIYYGVVTDMILWHTPDKDPKFDRFVHEWPVFNVADIVLVIGVILMLIDNVIEGKQEKLKRKQRDDKARKAGLIKNHGNS